MKAIARNVIYKQSLLLIKSSTHYILRFSHFLAREYDSLNLIFPNFTFVWPLSSYICSIWFLINYRYTIWYLLSFFRPESCQILVVDDVTNNCSKLVIKVHCLFYTMEKLHCYLLLNKKRRHSDYTEFGVIYIDKKPTFFFSFYKMIIPYLLWNWQPISFWREFFCNSK